MTGKAAMISIAEIEAMFSATQPGSGSEWTLRTLVPGRLHLSVDLSGNETIFVEGPLESFDHLPSIQGLEHRDDAREVGSGRAFEALRVTAPPTPHGGEAVTLIAYEMARTLEQDPSSDNKDLMTRVRWILTLLGVEPAVLSDERQRGLVAECLLLSRLLEIAASQSTPARAVLDRWWGGTGGKRDFAAVGIAIEVKSTASNTRSHHIASLDQLEPLSPGEDVYLFSVGLKSEPTSDRRLPLYIAEVAHALTDGTGKPDADAQYLFRQKLASAGYDSRFDGIYNSGPGILPSPQLPPRLFRVSDLDPLRLTNFKGDQLPVTVTALSYDLEIQASALSQPEAQAVMAKLLVSPTI